ncbi:hypothetical protein D3C71_830330 [compost metagenome]
MQPTSIAPIAAQRPTHKATRVPKIKRDNTQRPRLSVPSGYCDNPSAAQAGGNKGDNRSCANGSFGAMAGANNATANSASTIAPPNAALGEARRATHQPDKRAATGAA